MIDSNIDSIDINAGISIRSIQTHLDQFFLLLSSKSSMNPTELCLIRIYYHFLNEKMYLKQAL